MRVQKTNHDHSDARGGAGRRPQREHAGAAVLTNWPQPGHSMSAIVRSIVSTAKGKEKIGGRQGGESAFPPASAKMPNPIHECIENFGPAPRRQSRWDRLTYFRVPKPLWLRQRPSDGLNTLFENLPALFTAGTVVWGHIIQANSLLFQPGADDCPGELVYSLTDAQRVDPDYLGQVAHQLFSLKGTEPADPDLAPIAEYLTNEMIRVFGLAVPKTISANLPCRISTTFFVRKHLPLRRLCTPLLPIVVNPVEPYVAMPLPARYWPQSLIDWWSR